MGGGEKWTVQDFRFRGRSVAMFDYNDNPLQRLHTFYIPFLVRLPPSTVLDLLKVLLTPEGIQIVCYFVLTPGR